MPTVLIDLIALGEGQRPFFTGDNTQAHVPAQPAAPETPIMSLNGLGVYSHFQRGDSVLILSGGVRLPFVYSIAMEPLVFNLNWVQVAEGTESPIGQIMIPNEGQAMEFKGSNADGIFILNGSLAVPGVDGPWYLSAKLDETNVATINQFYAPDSLNGLDLDIAFWLKIQHTIALGGAS